MGILHAHCPTRELLDLVADRWTLLVVLRLSDRPHRFNELLHQIEGISQRMLTVTLRRLEMDGMLTRTIVSSRPIRVEYALTPLGTSLCELVQGLQQWAESHVTEVQAARTAFWADPANLPRPATT